MISHNDLNAISPKLNCNKYQTNTIPLTASTHVWPHPLEQHLCLPSQSLSCSHSSTQAPTNPPSKAGQVPGLGPEDTIYQLLSYKWGYKFGHFQFHFH